MTEIGQPSQNLLFAFAVQYVMQSLLPNAWFLRSPKEAIAGAQKAGLSKDEIAAFEDLLKIS